MVQAEMSVDTLFRRVATWLILEGYLVELTVNKMSFSTEAGAHVRAHAKEEPWYSAWVDWSKVCTR